jgi:hypothetical protein
MRRKLQASVDFRSRKKKRVQSHELSYAGTAECAPRMAWVATEGWALPKDELLQQSALARPSASPFVQRVEFDQCFTVDFDQC